MHIDICSRKNMFIKVWKSYFFCSYRSLTTLPLLSPQDFAYVLISFLQLSIQNRSKQRLPFRFRTRSFLNFFKIGMSASSFPLNAVCPFVTNIVICHEVTGMQALTQSFRITSKKNVQTQTGKSDSQKTVIILYALENYQ